MPRGWSRSDPWAVILASAVAIGSATRATAQTATVDSVAPPLIVAPAVAAFPAPRLGGYIQLREAAQERVGLTATLNRARFSMDGGLPARFSYRFLVELEASAVARNPATVSLREAIIRWSPAPLAISAGQFKTPFSREYLIPVPLVETADLATVVDSLAPKYDVGVMGEVAYRTFGTLAIGVFNGEGQNATANRDSLVMLVARLVVTPIPQLALGGNATRDGPDSLRWGLESNIEQSGAVVRAEYITRHRRGRARGLDDHGWYVFGSYRVTPRVQLIARQEDFQRPQLGASKRLRGTTLGANIEIAPNRVRLLLEGLRRTAGPGTTHTNAFIAQTQVRF
jgi:phosphate-selective porin